MQWCFSQVKGAIDDDVAEGKSSPQVIVVAESSWLPSIYSYFTINYVVLDKWYSMQHACPVLFHSLASPMTSHFPKCYTTSLADSPVLCVRVTALSISDTQWLACCFLLSFVLLPHADTVCLNIQYGALYARAGNCQGPYNAILSRYLGADMICIAIPYCDFYCDSMFQTHSLPYVCCRGKREP